MKASLSLIAVLLFGVCLIPATSFADSDDFDYSVYEGAGEEVTIEFSNLGPNPQREYCIYTWNDYYDRHDIPIKVNSEGVYDEIIVFTCPDCSLEKHYVEPFLNSKVDGKTGADRIREGGFLHAKFQGSKGIQEIERVLLTDVESSLPTGKSKNRDVKEYVPSDLFWFAGSRRCEFGGRQQ